MGQPTSYLVNVLKCEESGMLVGSSSDIPGLTLEAKTPRGIVKAIMEVAPLLMMRNLNLSSEEVGECVINVQTQDTPTTEGQRTQGPHIFLDSDLLNATA